MCTVVRQLLCPFSPILPELPSAVQLVQRCSSPHLSPHVYAELFLLVGSGASCRNRLDSCVPSFSDSPPHHQLCCSNLSLPQHKSCSEFIPKTPCVPLLCACTSRLLELFVPSLRQLVSTPPKPWVHATPGPFLSLLQQFVQAREWSHAISVSPLQMRVRSSMSLSSLARCSNRGCSSHSMRLKKAKSHQSDGPVCKCDETSCQTTSSTNSTDYMERSKKWRVAWFQEETTFSLSPLFLIVTSLSLHKLAVEPHAQSVQDQEHTQPLLGVTLTIVS